MCAPLKINFKKFFRDHMWFGWYWTKDASAIGALSEPGWKRARTPVAWMQKIR